MPKVATVIAIVGPTASGKSALALRLAERFDGEIVSMDSALVYRHMDIGTAKPTLAEQAAVPHHLLDLIDPTASYSAARFVTDCVAACMAIHARGKLPIIVGGTMLYFKAFVEGLDDLPSTDLVIRATVEADAAALGWPALHAQLATVDPATAARLQPTDAQRISRALEVWRIAGKPLSAYFSKDRAHTLPFRLIGISLEPSDRSVLHQRIAQRFDAMLGAGLLDELRALQQRYILEPNLPSMRCVGYRQAWQYLAGEIDYDALRETGIIATRQLCKRQLTWLRGMPDLHRLDCLQNDVFGAALRYLEPELSVV